MMPRIVFMGSPEFALPVLRRLAEQYPIIGVVTQPDRPAGRGRSLTPPPVKLLAQELQLQIIQPARLRQPEAMQQLLAWSPDLIVVAAFGQILRQEVLAIPKFGCINVHASLLPRWRGAAPIQAAILNGDEQTGVTIMLMDQGVDTGPMLNQRSIPIDAHETAGSLASKLSVLGADLLLETLEGYLSNSIHPQPQEESLATYAPMLSKVAGLLDFSQPSILLERKIRAFNPWPGAYTYWKDQLLKIHLAHSVIGPKDEVGTRIVYQGFPAVITGQGLLVLDELQPAGKTIMSGKTFLQGARHWAD